MLLRLRRRKLARGRKAVTADQEEKLYSLILEELLMGSTFQMIKEKVQRRAPTLSPPTVTKWIESVMDAIAVTKRDAAEGRAFRLGLAEQRLHDIYERSIAANDLKMQLAVTQQYIRLYGLEVKKPPTNTIQVHTSGPTMVGTQRGNVTAIQQADDEEEAQAKPKSLDELKKLTGHTEPDIIDQEDEDDTAGVGEGDVADPSGEGRGEDDPEESSGPSGAGVG